MGNLLGSPFKPWVKGQIETRQKSLGEYTNISSKDLQFYSTRTPFIRLASSVNLTNNGPNGTELDDSVRKKLVAAGVSEELIKDDQLAKNFILQGGSLAAPEDGSAVLNSGLNNPSNPFSGAYGWGGISERGYVPMPGITQADVQYQNDGALTLTTINVRCYSKAQFQLLDVLYLRPGYTLLLEFGWSVYLDNSNNLQSFNNFYTNPLSILLNPSSEGGQSQYDIYKAIRAERETHYGNYDAVFGKITNFNWQFNTDGSYDCQIRLTGMGDVIESLKTNIVLPKKDVIGPVVPEEKTQPPLISNRNKTALNNFLYDLYQESKSSTSIETQSQIISGFKDQSGTVKDLEVSKGKLIVPGTNLDIEENESPQVYITFGTLLAYIQSNLLLYDNNIPITTFDVKFNDLDNDDNFLLKFPGEFSSDPTKCLIPYTSNALPQPEGLLLPSSLLNDVLTAGAKWEAGVYAGRLSNVYVNVNYIALILQQETDSEGSLPLIEFLQHIISGITKSLGGFNQITVKLGEEGNIRFIEKTPQRTDDFLPPKDELEFTRFNVYGVKPGVEGSFVRNISLTAEISNDFASMISIGSQANGNQLSANATSFSNYNAGLEDRIVKEKASNPTNDPTPPDSSVSLKDHYNNNVLPPLEKIYVNLSFLSENIASLVESNTQYAQLSLGELSKKSDNQQLQAPFFLPFNLSLDIDGMSGIRLYEKFLMTDDILPPSYEKDSVDLQVNGVNHSIDSAAWITKIDTLSVPKSELSSVVRPPQEFSQNTTQEAVETPPSAQSTPPPPPENLPEDEVLRVKHYRIMDDGTQTLGYYEVLDENQNVQYRLTSVELPWKGNQNSISCVPPDEYRVKSHTSGKHGNCFWLVGNKAGNFAFNQVYGNGFIRSAILIHKAPKAPGWLLGCQGPGFKFNKQIGKQTGTGTQYLSPSREESQQAVDKLVSSLFSVGSFRMTIENKFDQLPTSFSDPRVQQLIKELQLV